MPFRFPGRFVLIDSGRRPGAVVLRGVVRARERPVEILFLRVTAHDLPATLEGVEVRDHGPEHAYSVSSAGGGDYRVQAATVQCHEPATICDRVLTLARFRPGQRLLWTVLLWSARFAWGQALIRWLRGG